MNDNIKEFLQRLRIFAWYLFTEPFYRLKEIWSKLKILGRALNKTFTWSYFFVALAIIAMIVNNRTAAALLLMLLFLTILLWEWERGYFMHRYREHKKNVIKRKLEVKENDRIDRDK